MTYQISVRIWKPNGTRFGQSILEAHDELFYEKTKNMCWVDKGIELISKFPKKMMKFSDKIS